MAENLMPTCDKLLPKVGYMSDAQWEVDGCRCLREPGHSGRCRCEHVSAPGQEPPRG